MRCAFVGLVSRTTERDSESMTWKPDRRQIDLIAEYGAAHMPVEAIAAALDIHPDDLRGWIGKLRSDALPASLRPARIAACATAARQPSWPDSFGESVRPS